MNIPEKTSKNGTFTSEGFIPHYYFNSFKLPIKLNIPRDQYSMDQLFAPLKRNNQFVYALPQGGESTIQELKFSKNKDYGLLGMKQCST